jgi:hypothetical protein
MRLALAGGRQITADITPAVNASIYLRKPLQLYHVLNQKLILPLQLKLNGADYAIHTVTINSILYCFRQCEKFDAENGITNFNNRPTQRSYSSPL